MRPSEGYTREREFAAGFRPGDEPFALRSIQLASGLYHWASRANQPDPGKTMPSFLDGLQAGREAARKHDGQEYWDGYEDGLAEGRKQQPPAWWRDGVFFLIGVGATAVAFYFL